MIDAATAFPIEHPDGKEFDLDKELFIPSRDRNDVRSFLAALAAAQAAYQPVVRSREVRIKPRDKAEYSFKYAELANVIDATKALSENGISVTQPLHEDREGITWLYTILTHAAGAGRITRIKLGGEDEIKTWGGIITYLRRYCLAPAIGVASEDDADSNGDGGGGGFNGDTDDDSPRRYSRERDESPQMAKPARASGVRSTKPAAAPAADAAVKLVTTGQLKNILAKLAAHQMDDATEKAMLARLDIPVVDASMTLAQWQRLNAELAN